MKPKPSSIFPHLSTRNAVLEGEEMRFRTFELDRAGVNAQARTVPLSFSSEAPVERWFGSEILAHEPSAVRMGRLNNGGALLLDHDRNRQIGVVESAVIGSDKKGRAVVRFSKSALAEEIFQDVQDGIRRLVSVGYRVHKTETTNESGGVESVRVTDWEPYEISIVSIPADDSVGVGRGASHPANQNQNQTFSNTMNREQILARLRALGIAFHNDASTDTLRLLLPEAERGATVPPAPEPSPAPTATRSEPAPVPRIAVVNEPSPQAVANTAIEGERRRTAAIQEIADQARANGVEISANRAIADGVTPDAFREQVYNALLSRQSSYSPGHAPVHSRQEQRDIASFSMARGIQSLVAGTGLTGIEREMHEEAQREAQLAGLTLQGGLSIPTLVLNHGRRDMTALGNSGADGGNTIVTTQGSLIELLYNKLTLRGLGVQFLTGLSGNFSLPKLLTGTAPAKVAETTATGESSPTTGLVNFTPKRAGRFVEYSKQLIRQSPIAWESVLRNDLTTMLAILMETGAITGGGTDEPTGLLNTSGIGSVAGGTNGLALTRSNAIKLKTAVSVANADMGSLGFLTNPAVRGKAQETNIDAGSGQFLWKEDRDDSFMGYKAGVTNNVPSTLDKGTSTGVCSAMVFGNFADLIIAQWGGIDIGINPYIKDTEGLIRITADCYYDAAVRRPQSFAAIKDLLTA